MTASRIVVYGDFNCPWSYLAWRRSELLAADDVEVDWRAVEHDPWHHLEPADAGARFAQVQHELARVAGHLLDGEPFPHSFGAVPFTGPAIAAYAEAYVVGAAATARRLLFEGLWLEAVNLNDPRAVRSVVVDAVRGRPSRSELIRLWGYAVDVTGGSITTDGWRTVRDWRSEWEGLGERVVPALVVDDGDPLHGEAAIDRLGEEISARGLDLHPPGAEARAATEGAA